MFATLKRYLAQFRKWMAENERAHKNAKASACCSSPDAIHAASHSTKARDGRK